MYVKIQKNLGQAANSRYVDHIFMIKLCRS